MYCTEPALATLQQRVIRALFQADASTGVLADIQASATLSPAQRLGIYRNGVQAVLTTHLQAVYPVCQQLVGYAFFSQTVGQFVAQQPSDSPALADYGVNFADFLAQHSALQTLPWLADVARLEWARHAAWHAANQAVMDFSPLVTLTAEQQSRLRFYLPQSALLLRSDFAIQAVWLAHQPDDYPEKVPLDCIHIQHETYLFLWRMRRSLHQVELSAQQWQFLADVQSGLTLSELAMQYADALPALLMHSVQHGWLISFGEAYETD